MPQRHDLLWSFDVTKNDVEVGLCCFQNYLGKWEKNKHAHESVEAKCRTLAAWGQKMLSSVVVTAPDTAVSLARWQQGDQAMAWVGVFFYWLFFNNEFYSFIFTALIALSGPQTVYSLSFLLHFLSPRSKAESKFCPKLNQWLASKMGL